jgi:hypothetical protein
MAAVSRAFFPRAYNGRMYLISVVVVRKRHLNPYPHPFAPRRGPEVPLQGVDSGVYQAGSKYCVDVCVL